MKRENPLYSQEIHKILPPSLNINLKIYFLLCQKNIPSKNEIGNRRKLCQVERN